MSRSGDRLREIARRAETEGGRAAAQAMADSAADAIQLALARKSHAPNTKTPSAPGQPPAKITGRLLRSVKATRAIQEGAGRWVADAGSFGVFYAGVHTTGKRIRIKHAPYLRWFQDGGWHSAKEVYLPPRPFVKPTAQEQRLSGKTKRASVEAFRQAVHGG